MAEQHEQGRRDARLAALCSRLATPGGPLAEDAELRALVANVLAGVREGRPWEEVDEQLDDLEDRLLVTGHTAGLGAYRGGVPVPGNSAYEPLPGLGGGRALLEVRTCPRGRCTRVEAPAGTSATAAPSRCSVFDEPLRLLDITP
ncbi:hypothetical protein [Streptomyces lomondensis]|uniref:Uncharacterized protein n=1 Tax=Streptomyces lomondensis TaxID=68229 RepID=A0ABQ2XJ00_9ACTN|nr:hypothetical protein [Streptomyces lomondensis]MCF0080446.1 hypothetical protein [Streptomyces lomondensis]GGX16903.1 hypothetical protein GCM10010383_53800 [Streptomyces lomondensis]